MASPLPKPPLDLEAAVREVTKGFELASELHSVLREVMPRGDGRLESAFRLSRDVQQTLSSALTILKPRRAKFRASDPLALEISLPSIEGVESRAASSITDAKPQQDMGHKNPNPNPKKRLAIKESKFKCFRYWYPHQGHDMPPRSYHHRSLLRWLWESNL